MCRGFKSLLRYQDPKSFCKPQKILRILVLGGLRQSIFFAIWILWGLGTPHAETHL